METQLPGLPNGRAGLLADSIAVLTDLTPLKPYERGIILTSNSSVMVVGEATSEGTRFYPRHMQKVRPDPHELRSALLMWDKVHLPEPIWGKSLKLGADLSFLEAEGVLWDAEVKAPKGLPGALVAPIAREKLFRALDSISPSKWALSGWIDGIAMPEDALVNEKGLLVTLHNMLPIPDQDVSLEDLLNFRIKYAQERLELKERMEQLYDEIRASQDRPLRELRATEEIARVSDDIVQKLARNGIKGMRGSISAALDFDWVSAVKAFVPTTLETGSFVSGGLAGISAGSFPGLKKKAAGNAPYTYSMKLHRELKWL